MAKALIDIFSSLKLTVVCLTLAMVLVFVGTLAQVEQGLFQAQKEYFQSFFVFWSPGGGELEIPVFPGGYLLGGVLLVNLVAAHFKRFQFSRKKVGVFLIHFGLVVLLLGQLATDMLQVESHMRLREGQSTNYSESGRETELVIIDTTDPDQNQVYSIDSHRLKEGREIRVEALPFTVRVKEFYANSRIPQLMDREARTKPPENPPATRGMGLRYDIREVPKTVKMDERNLPSAVVELVSPEGSLGTWLVSSMVDEEQSFEYGGSRYELGLRFKRYYKPFTVELLDFKHDKYAGTSIPKNFSSRIRVYNPSTGEDREALIYMNHPLRYWGETYYQSGFDERDDKVTILQVVRNPGWLTPYVACLLVAAGLVVQFSMHLISFVKRKKA